MTGLPSPTGPAPIGRGDAPARGLGLAAILSLICLAACQREQPPPPPVATTQTPVAAPQPKLPPPQTGVASYYGGKFAGRTTASGEPYKPEALTAASRSLPIGAKAKVTNTKTGQSVAVRVNDHGPYAKHRILDVSHEAARHLGMNKDGVAPVKVQPLHVPPKDASGAPD